jgi:hypothetical protein
VKLETQIVSFELSKRLKELGVKQDSVYGWFDSEVSGPQLVRLSEATTNAQIYGEWVSAFTVAELGEMMKEKTMHQIYTPANGWGWQFMFRGKDMDIFAPTEADARAKLLIHLIEQGILKPPVEEAHGGGKT